MTKKEINYNSTLYNVELSYRRQHFDKPPQLVPYVLEYRAEEKPKSFSVEGRTRVLKQNLEVIGGWGHYRLTTWTNKKEEISKLLHQMHEKLRDWSLTALNTAQEEYNVIHGKMITAEDCIPIPYKSRHEPKPISKETL